MNQTYANITKSDSIPTFGENLIASGIMFVLALIGLLAYVLTVAIILRYRSEFSNAFYRYLLSLAFSDMLCLCLMMFYAVPLTIWQKGPKTIAPFVGCIMLATFYSNIFLMTSISVNRFYAVRKSNVYNQKYNTFRVRLNLGVVWSIAITLAFLPYLSGKGETSYNYEKYQWEFQLGDSTSTDQYLWINRLLASVCLAILFICYCFIIVTLRSQRKVQNDEVLELSGEAEYEVELELQNKRNEVVFSLQFLGIGLCLFICLCAFTFIPMFTQYRWYLFIFTVLWIGNSCVNPFIYLLTNYQLRGKLFEMFGVQNTAVVVSDSPVSVTKRINPAVNLYLSPPVNKHGHAKYDAKPDLAMMRMKIQEARSID